MVHDTIVSLEDRLQDLLSRYPAARAVIEKKRPIYEEFERKYGLEKVELARMS